MDNNIEIDPYTKSFMDESPYGEFMAVTKLGLMFNIMNPWNSENGKFKSGRCNWIRAEDIIGVECYKDEWYLRVKYRVGHGINGTDSSTQVTEDAFEMVCNYFQIP